MCVLVKYCQILLITPVGFFNASNKLYITLDVLFEVRSHVRRGEPPGNCAQAILESCSQFSQMTPEEKQYLTDKLYEGYFHLKQVPTETRIELSVVSVE